MPEEVLFSVIIVVDLQMPKTTKMMRLTVIYSLVDRCYYCMFAVVMLYSISKRSILLFALRSMTLLLLLLKLVVVLLVLSLVWMVLVVVEMPLML